MQLETMQGYIAKFNRRIIAKVPTILADSAVVDLHGDLCEGHRRVTQMHAAVTLVYRQRAWRCDRRPVDTLVGICRVVVGSVQPNTGL